MPDNPTLDIVIPLYNEEKILAASVRRLISFLTESRFPYRYTVTLTNNASTDGSAGVMADLSKEFPQVRALNLDKKGKGFAIRTAWGRSECGILSFMDVDLSSDLTYFLPLINAVTVERFDISIGNRRGKDSKVFSNKFLRRIASGLYNAAVRALLGTSIEDHQCGFKAMNREAYRTIASRLEEDGFFIDTELLAVASRERFTVRSIDIVWNDSAESKVSLFSDSIKMFYDIMRLRRKMYRMSRDATALNKGVDSVFTDEQFSILFPEGTRNHYWNLTKGRVISDVLAHLAPKGILDIGAGAGAVTAYIKERGFPIWGSELGVVPVPKGLEAAFFSGKNISELPSEMRNTIDTILLLDVVEHLSDPKALINEAEESLPNLQNIVISVPARMELWSNLDVSHHHYVRYDRPKLLQLMKALGWKDSYSGYFFHALYWPALAIVKLGHNRSTELYGPRGWKVSLHRAIAAFLYYDYKLLPRSLVGSSVLGIFKR